MSSPTLRNIVLFVFIIALIPLVFIPFYNKQKELTSDISKYEEILSAIDTQGQPDNKDIYERYMESVLGTYDEREPRNNSIQSALNDIDDIVNEFDLSEYSRIEADVNLPTIDLSKSKTYDYDIGDSQLEVVYEKPNEYDESIKDIFMYTHLLFNGIKLCNVQIRGIEDGMGVVSLHLFDDRDLKYPVAVVGEERAGAYKDQKFVYFLIDSQVVRYDTKYNDSLTNTVLSTLDVDIYIKDGTEYLFTYWEDSTLSGKKIMLWRIDHNNRLLIKEMSVLEIG